MNGEKFVYTYPTHPIEGNQYIGLAIIGCFVLLIIVCACWPQIEEWFNKHVRYKNHTIKSFIICQKSPDIDLKKIYRVVDDTNDFLRGKEIKGVTTKRKKIKTKNLISITSIQGNDCYYFIAWYKD